MKKIIVMAVSISGPTAMAKGFSVNAKLGHQNLRFSASDISTVTEVTTRNTGAPQHERTMKKEKFSDSFSNSAVGGLRTGYGFDSFDLQADLDFARHHTIPKTWLDFFSVTVLAQVPIYRGNFFTPYYFGGGSFRKMYTHFGQDEQALDVDTEYEPIEIFNLDAGLGLKYKPSERFSVNLEYKYSDTISADGDYMKSSYVFRPTPTVVATANSRTKFNDLKATVQEITLFTTWTI